METTGTPPERIWLQCGDIESDVIQPDYEVTTWCVDQINGEDTEYLRFDIHEREVAALTAQRDKAAAYIVEASSDQIGSGDDPVGFLIASHRHIADRLRTSESELVAAKRALAEKDAQTYWLVRSLGGEGSPLHAFCRTTDDVRRAIGALIWGDYEHAEKQELDTYMTDFADPDNWGADGTHWIIQFEIDGIEAILLDPAAAFATKSPLG